MSRERARARAERAAQRVREREQAERARSRADLLRRLSPAVRVRHAITLRSSRSRRYGAMPPRARLALGLGWLAAQTLLWQLVDGGRARVGFALLTLAALPVVAVLLPAPSPRSRR